MITLINLVLILTTAILVGSLPNEQYMGIMFPVLMGYLTIVIGRKVFFTYQAYRSMKRNGPPPIKSFPMVSIVVPCFNEEKVIANTIDNLKSLNYPNYEIIIVDDGSTDRTLRIAFDKRGDSVRVLTQPNKGKAAALNYGIDVAEGEFVLCVDADSTLAPNTIQEGLKHFRDKEVGAVAGFVEVKNQNNLLTKFQAFEYSMGLNFIRRALANFGIVPVIPGPVGLFRRSVLDQVGGYLEDRKLMAEDAELTLRIANAGYKVNSEENMVAYTEAPESWMSLFRQRYRWNRGIVQALKLNLNRLLRSNERSFWLGLHLVFETYGVLYMNLLMLVSFITHHFVAGQYQLLDKWFVGLVVSELITVALVCHKSKQYLRSFSMALLSIFCYNNILMFWRLFTTVDEAKGKPISWDKLERTGS